MGGNNAATRTISNKQQKNLLRKRFLSKSRHRKSDKMVAQVTFAKLKASIISLLFNGIFTGSFIQAADTYSKENNIKAFIAVLSKSHSCKTRLAHRADFKTSS